MPHLFNQEPGVFKDSLWSPYGSPNVDLKQIDLVYMPRSGIAGSYGSSISQGNQI